MIKRAMVTAVVEGLLERFGALELLQVHDALVFEVPERKAKGFGLGLKGVMEGVARLSVPVVAEVSMGRNWAEQTALEV